MRFENNDLAAIVLAAGLSRRFGVENKLHALLDCETCVVERVIQRVTEFPFKHRSIVSAADDLALAKIANQYRVSQVTNNHPELGMGTSISLGVSALDESKFSGVAIFLGDMPFLRPETIAATVKEFHAMDRQRIVRPCFHEKPGHPVIFQKSLLPKLRTLRGDRGANSIVQQNLEQLPLLPTSDRGVLQDVDVPSDINKKRTKLSLSVRPADKRRTKKPRFQPRDQSTSVTKTETLSNLAF